MGAYLRSRLQPALDVIDNDIAFLQPRAGYAQTPDRDRRLAELHVLRAGCLAVLTRCGVDDAALAALPAEPRQTRDEFLAEIAALTNSVKGG
jgi:hypothetical protein